MKIVVLDGYTLNPGDLSWDALAALGELTVYDRTAPEEIVPRIGDAQIIYTNKTPLTAATFDACPQICFVGVLATGYNVVDCEAAKSHGVAVTNIPTYGTAAVAQYVFALLLEVCHHVAAHSQAVKEGQWASCPDFCFWRHPLIELAGKTMGIIGFGRIGQNVAQIANAFGMRVLAYDKYKNPALVHDMCQYATLDELLLQSDVISLHCPLFPATQGLLNAERIAKMKDGVIILNTSRGPLIVEEDMRQALLSGKVYYCASDVVSTEPITMDNPLLHAPRTLITPHIAWAPRESRQRLMDIAVDNLRQYLAGQPQNVVNL